MTAPLLQAKGVSRDFPIRRRGTGQPIPVRAVDDVSLELDPGRTLGVVGESGCGKTTLGRLLLLLDVPTRGSVLFQGRDTAAFSIAERREFYRAVQPVFQDPYASLNPRMRVGNIVGEPLRASGSLGRARNAERVASVLETVGLRAADAGRYPHEFSGGQRQRIAIARALACNPRIIILDEAVSSQDISIRAQILNLLKDLQRDTGLGYLFIAHDLATVRYMSDHISVMYLGRVVEHAASEALFQAPLHPYTAALLAACLPDDPDAAAPACLPGEPASALNPPVGCHFHPRCPSAGAECRAAAPPLREVAPGRVVACFLHR